MSFYDDWQSAIPSPPTSSSFLDDWNSAKPITPPPSSADWWIEQGLRTGPAVVGSLLGGLTAEVTGPFGAMAGGAGGSALGTWMGDLYSGKKSNPTEYAVNTVLGGLPPMLGSAKLGGEGLADLLKYGAKSAALGGLEGGVVGAGSVPFQHYAQTGDFNASPEEYLQGAGSGALFGTALGGGLGTIHGIHAQNRLAELGRGPQGPGPMYGPMPPPEAPPVMDQRGQNVFPFMHDPTLDQRPPSEPPPPEAFQPNLFDSPNSSFTEPVQGDFTNQLGPYRGVRGRFTREQPPFVQPGDNQFQLPFDPYQSYQGVPRESPFQVGRPPTEPPTGPPPIQFTGTPTMADMAPPSRPPIEVPPSVVSKPPTEPADPNQYIRGVIFKDDLAIITEPRSAIAPMLAARGYEPIGVKDNYPTWQLKQDITQTPFARAKLATENPSLPEGMPESPMPMDENGHITVPARLATKSRLDNFAQNGYVVVEEHPNGDITMGPGSTEIPSVNPNYVPPKDTLETSPPEDLTAFQQRRRNVIDLFRTNLPQAESWGRTRFILPDGTRLTHNHTIHEDAANYAGTTLQGALDSGIVRVSEGFGPVQIEAPITTKQAEVLADSVHYTGKPVIIETHRFGGDYDNSMFDKSSTSQDILNWVNPRVKRSFNDTSVLERRAGGENATDAWASMTSIPKRDNRSNYTSVLYDRNNKMGAAEKANLANHPMIRATNQVMDQIIRHIEGVNNKLIGTIHNIGTVIDPKVLGLFKTYPDAENISAILVNHFEHWKEMTPEDAASGIVETIYHELAHIDTGHGKTFKYDPIASLDDPNIGPELRKHIENLAAGGETDKFHDISWMSRMIEYQKKVGVEQNAKFKSDLAEIFTGSKPGEYSPEIPQLLQRYAEVTGRKRPAPDPLAAAGIEQANTRPTPEGNIPGNAQGSGGGTPSPPAVKKPSLLREAYNFARGATTTGDLSAPLRQGLPLIFTKQFWTSLSHMRKALGDEGAFQKTLKDLRNRPLFRRYDPNTGKFTKSFAEMAGMKLSDLKTLTSREEAVASNWVEKGGFLGSDVPYLNKETSLQRGYQNTAGRYARATNRAYTAFLNQLRADSFESLLGDAFKDFKAGTKGAKNPYTDLTYAREIADFVNTATGRGPLKLATPGVVGGRLGEGGKIGLVERSGEQFAKFFTDLIFSPRLMASRVRMLNPATYMMASPFVRKQYIKSLLSVAGFAGTMGALAKGMGADVSLDTNSADFGKIRIGNTRLDMAGGFQQYLVAGSRLLSGHTTSSASGKDFELGQGYRPPTRGDVIQGFMTNKLHPVVKFANDLVFASTHQPFQVGDRTLQLFVPLVIGDVLDLAREDPSLLPLIAPVALGAGSQTYDKGASMSKFIPKANDLNFTGGEFIK